MCVRRAQMFDSLGEEAGFNVVGKKDGQNMLIEAPEDGVVELLAKSFELQPMKAE